MAIADYNAAIQMDSVYAEAYNNRGVAYDAKGEHDRAIADYTAAIRIDPSLAHTYHNRSFARHRLGDYAGAEDDIRKAKELGFEG